MPFPNSYKKTISPLKKCNDTLILISEIRKKMGKFDPYEMKVSKNSLAFKSKRSLFSIPYNVEIFIDNKMNITYEFFLTNVVKISIMIFVFIPFFSNFSFNSYLIFAFFIVFLFYYFSLTFINSSLKSSINKIWDTPDLEIIDQQKEWISNPDKCPACGAFVSQLDNECFDCGLSIKNSGNQSRFNFRELNFHYIYKKKNDN